MKLDSEQPSWPASRFWTSSGVSKERYGGEAHNAVGFELAVNAVPQGNAVDY